MAEDTSIDSPILVNDSSNGNRERIAGQCIDMILSMRYQRRWLVVFVLIFYASVWTATLTASVFTEVGIVVGIVGALLLTILHVLLSLQKVNSDEVGALTFFGAPAKQVNSGLVFAPLFLSKLVKDKKSFIQLLFGAPFRNKNGDEIDPRGDQSQRTFLLVDPSLDIQFGKYLDLDEILRGHHDVSDARAQAQPTEPHLGARFYLSVDPIGDAHFGMRDAFEKLVRTRKKKRKGKLKIKPEPCGYAIFITFANSVREVNQSIKEAALQTLADWAGKHTVSYTLLNMEKLRDELTLTVEERVGERAFRNDPDRANAWWGINVESVWPMDLGLSEEVNASLKDAGRALADASATERRGKGEKRRLALEGEGQGQALQAVMKARAKGIHALAQELNKDPGQIALQLDTIQGMLQKGNNDIHLIGSDLGTVLGAAVSKFASQKAGSS